MLNALLDQAENGDITMAYIDEAGHSTIQPNRTCWTKEGDVHAIDAQRGPRLNVMGALLSDGSLFTTEKWGTTKADDFLAFLEKLVARVKPTMEKPLYAIVDNASIHKAKTIQEGIAANVIIDGNHRYITWLLCNQPVESQPWTAPLSKPRMPVSKLQILP